MIWCQHGARSSHHEEAVDDDVEGQGGELVAGVVVVPHADLDGDDDGGVEEEHRA